VVGDSSDLQWAWAGYPIRFRSGSSLIGLKLDNQKRWDEIPTLAPIDRELRQANDDRRSEDEAPRYPVSEGQVCGRTTSRVVVRNLSLRASGCFNSCWIAVELAWWILRSLEAAPERQMLCHPAERPD
jgi:hypothetical protein